MKYLLILVGVLCLVGGVSSVPGAEASDGILNKMQSEIETDLQSGSWNDASKAMVLAIWNDFKTAVEKRSVSTTQPLSAHGQPPAAEDLLGIYRLGPSKKQLEIRREKGMLVVVLERHPLPAVVVGDSIYFTTGDVIIAPNLPQLGGQHYATLEFLALNRSADGLTLRAFTLLEKPIRITKVAE